MPSGAWVFTCAVLGPWCDVFGRAGWVPVGLACPPGPEAWLWGPCEAEPWGWAPGCGPDCGRGSMGCCTLMESTCAALGLLVWSASPPARWGTSDPLLGLPAAWLGGRGGPVRSLPRPLSGWVPVGLACPPGPEAWLWGPCEAEPWGWAPGCGPDCGRGSMGCCTLMESTCAALGLLVWSASPPARWGTSDPLLGLPAAWLGGRGGPVRSLPRPGWRLPRQPRQ